MACSHTVVAFGRSEDATGACRVGSLERSLGKGVKELTLFGLLSCILFIVQDTQLVSVEYDLIVAFEFAHYLIFLWL